MCSGSKETQCSHCDHLQVCSFKAQFLAAQKAVDKVTVGTGDRSITLRTSLEGRYGCTSWLRRLSLRKSKKNLKLISLQSVSGNPMI